jgi:hypothetical protein
MRHTTGRSNPYAARCNMTRFLESQREPIAAVMKSLEPESDVDCTAGGQGAGESRLQREGHHADGVIEPAT